MKTWHKAVEDYIQLRRSLGFKLDDAKRGLLKFAAFLEQRKAPHLTTPLALQWAQQDLSACPVEWARRLAFVRGFARHWSGYDSKTEVPPWGLLPHRPRRAQPYLYTEDQIGRLLEAAKSLSSGHPLRPWTYYCLFGLLAVTGLRISEARNLQLEDVDLAEGILTVRGTKFGKSRLVPLHASTRKVLSAYAAHRDRWLPQRPTAYFFVSQCGTRLDGSRVRRTFYKLSRRTGLREATASHGPRLHDLRQHADSPIMPNPTR